MSTPAPSKTTDETVDAFFQHFSTGDIPAILDLFTNPTELLVTGPPAIPWAGRRTTPEELAVFFALFGTELSPPLEFTVSARVTQGQHAVVLGRNRFEVLATHKAFTNEFAIHFTVTDGKISSYHMYEDTHAIYSAFTGSTA